MARSAERKAELLRRAQDYEDEGLGGIALHLRQQADRIDLDKPLASVLPALAHWQGDAPGLRGDETPPRRSLADSARDAHKSLTPSRKNGRKS